MQNQQDLENKLAQIQALLDQLRLELNQQPKPVVMNQVNDAKSQVIPPPKQDLVITTNVPVSQVSSEKPKIEQELPDTQTVRSEETDNEGPPIGQVGVFDGEFVFMPNDKKYQVPPNYASKTQLVAGDKLELVSCGNLNEFKLAQQIERVEVEGILTKKNFQWTILINNEEFLLISASVRFFNGDIGDKAIVLLPKDYKDTKPKWAALKSISKSNVGDGGFAGSRSANDIERDKKSKYLPQNMKERKNEEYKPVPLQSPKVVKEPEKVATPAPVTIEPKSIPMPKELSVAEVSNKTGEIELEITSEMANIKVETPKQSIQTDKPLISNTVSNDSSVPPLR